MTLTNKNIAWVSDEFAVDADKILTAEYCNSNEDNRIAWCTTLAAVSRGKYLSANPSVRYKALLKEAAPIQGLGHFDTANSPSRPLEFIGVALNAKFTSSGDIKIRLKSKEGFIVCHEFSFVEFQNMIGRFSFLSKSDFEDFPIRIHTNMRALLNAGILYDNIPYNTPEEMSGFKAVRVRAPMFVFNHLVTHTALSKEARSERVVDFLNMDLVPEDGGLFEAPFDEAFWRPEAMDNNEFMKILHEMTLPETMNYLKEKGYKKEIYQRAVLEWRYKDFMMVGWRNPFTWDHLFLERSAMDEYQNWTQEETKETVKTIRAVIDKDPTIIGNTVEE